MSHHITLWCEHCRRWCSDELAVFVTAGVHAALERSQKDFVMALPRRPLPTIGDNHAWPVGTRFENDFAAREKCVEAGPECSRRASPQQSRGHCFTCAEFVRNEEINSAVQELAHWEPPVAGKP